VVVGGARWLWKEGRKEGRKEGNCQHRKNENAFSQKHQQRKNEFSQKFQLSKNGNFNTLWRWNSIPFPIWKKKTEERLRHSKRPITENDLAHRSPKLEELLAGGNVWLNRCSATVPNHNFCANAVLWAIGSKAVRGRGHFGKEGNPRL
jgi:hypothetical protein